MSLLPSPRRAPNTSGLRAAGSATPGYLALAGRPAAASARRRRRPHRLQTRRQLPASAARDLSRALPLIEAATAWTRQQWLAMAGHSTSVGAAAQTLSATLSPSRRRGPLGCWAAPVAPGRPPAGRAACGGPRCGEPLARHRPRSGAAKPGCGTPAAGHGRAAGRRGRAARPYHGPQQLQ